MASAAAVTFASLKNDLAKRKFAPVYLIHGEQGFYIDELVTVFENIIPEADRPFNLYNLYAPEHEPSDIIDACRSYSMMSDLQVVILREAQAVTANYLKSLIPYVERPNPSTLFVICSRGEAIKSKELLKAVKSAGGVVFETPVIKEYQVSSAVSAIVKDAGFAIEPKALSMLCDHVGADLSRVHNELTKLKVTLPKGAMITPEVVERNIGVSKDYNNFELISAIGNHDELKVMKIAEYFAANPKAHPIFPTLGELFRYFSNMLIILYTPDRSDRGLMDALNFRHPMQLKDLKGGLRYYNAWHVIEILRCIRRCDAAAKGVDSRQNGHQLLRDLLYRILHPTGRI